MKDRLEWIILLCESKNPQQPARSSNRLYRALRSACHGIYQWTGSGAFPVQRAGRPNIYLPSAQLSKEALIEELLTKELISEGPIALLSCVEPCLSFRVRGDHQSKTVRLVVTQLA